MPKSRKRQQPNRIPLGAGGKTLRPLSKTVILPDGRETSVSYRPGRFKTDTEYMIWMATQIPPDFAVTLLPVVLLLDPLRGRSANVCLDACLTLKHTYRLLDIDARIMPVSVLIETPNGDVSIYGRDPRWDGDVFRGHCVLWLPDLQRLVDPTSQQFPELESDKAPIIGRIQVATADTAGELPIGTTLPILREGAQLTYQVEATEAFITDAEQSRNALAKHPKNAPNLAGWTISIVAHPDIAPRLRGAPFPRINALIDAVDGAQVVANPSTGYRFVLPGPHDIATPKWIDEILPNQAAD